MSAATITRPIEYLKIVNSYECARACSYCYNTVLGQSIPAVPEQLRRTLREILDSRDTPVAIEFIGGEPLQASNLDDTLELLSLVREHPMCGDVFVSSAIVASTALERALPLIDTLYLSVDFSKVYNRKPATDRQLERVIAIADASSTFVSASSVLQGDESFDDMWMFADRLLGAGFSAWGLTHKSYLSLSEKQITRIRDQYYDLFRLAMARRGEISIFSSILDSVTTLIRGGTKTGACECGGISMVLEPDGTLSPGVCQDHNAGALEPSEFRSIQSERAAVLRDGECAGCPLWTVCHGGCMTEATRLTGSPLRRSTVECDLLTGIWSRVSADLASMAGARSETDAPRAH